MVQIKFNLPDPRIRIAQFLNTINIWHIILFSAILRFFAMPFPNDGGMIFDEVHYIKATRAMMEGIAANAEHPPLVKIMELISIKIFGDHWFAWRFPIVLLALLGTYFMYKATKEWLKDERAALVAASLLSFDIIYFIHGNIYMLEIPALAISLGFVCYYLKKSYLTSAVMMGIAFLCNEKALFILFGVAIYHVMAYTKSYSISKHTVKLFKFLGVCVIVGAGGLWLSDCVWRPASSSNVNIATSVVIGVDGQGNPLTSVTNLSTQTSYMYINDPVSHFFFMVNYYLGINQAIPQYNTTWRPPWSWILPIGANWNNPPVYFATSVTFGDKMYMPINYVARSTYPIWWMTIPILLASLYFIIFRKKDEGAGKEGKFLLGTLVGTYGWWFVWELFKMNMPFNHYMMFAVPFLCMGIPWFWLRFGGKYRYSGMILHLVVVFLFLLVNFPVGVFRTI